ncbi:MAG TPA: SRPBCC domain-containing protein [Verrucomicrobiae bacterium]|nr:SRPBCC domain-containing protein [Verrucomicrobiae bacterium]
MRTQNKPAKKATEFKAVISRVIQAPRALVFKMWTDAEHMAQWFSPADIECRSLTAAVKVGGKFRIHMVSKKGDHIAIGKYLKIVPDKYLQFTWQWEAYAMPESVVTVELQDRGGATLLTLTHQGFPDREDAEDHQRGWTSMLKKFAAWVKRGEFQPIKTKIKNMKKNTKTKIVQPYILFGGRCAEALKFYGKAVGAKVDLLMRFQDSPEPPPPGAIPPGYSKKVMHVTFRIGDSILMASDGCGEPVNFSSFSLHLAVATEAEAKRAFKALGAGGKVIMPMGKTFWSPCFGMLTDRFGLGWKIGVMTEN